MSFFNHFKQLVHDSNYNAQNSLSLGLACQLAYKREEEIKKVVNGWEHELIGCIDVKKKPDIDTQCFVMSDPENIVVVFRGSDSPMDWLANFQAVYDPGPFRGTKAHEGFQDSLFPSVMSITNMIDKSLSASHEKKIWVTGHSLGGALCSLYSAMLIEHGYKVYGVYTFASPRPADGTFARKLNERIRAPRIIAISESTLRSHKLILCTCRSARLLASMPSRRDDCPATK